MLCRLVSHPRITIDGLTRDAAHSTERGDGIDTRGALIDKITFFVYVPCFMHGIQF